MPSIFVPSSAKRIATQIFVTKNLNEKKRFFLRDFVCDIIGISCSKLVTEAQE